MTRSEYLGVIDSDYLMIQTPNHLPEDQIQLILDRLASGAPTMILGSPVGGVDRRIAAAVGLHSASQESGDIRSKATRGSAAGEDVPETFGVVHRWSETAADADADVLYSVDGAPALVRHGSIAAWDPADVVHRKIVYSGLWDFGRHNGDRPVVELMGSPYPFLITAREISRVLREHGALSVGDVRANSPVTITAWRSGGHTHVLVAELEEGFRDSTDGSWEVRVEIPQENTEIELSLKYAESRLLQVTSEGQVDLW